MQYKPRNDSTLCTVTGHVVFSSVFVLSRDVNEHWNSHSEDTEREDIMLSPLCPSVPLFCLSLPQTPDPGM